MKRFMLFLAVLVGSISSNCFSIDYSKAFSPEDILMLETREIENSRGKDPALAISNLLNRAESYLLLGDHQKALNDYDDAYFLFSKIEQNEHSSMLLARTLFGGAISAFNLGLDDRGWEFSDQLKQFTDDLQRPECGCLNASRTGGLGYGVQLANSTIQGPDQATVAECVERADGTAKAMKVLALRARREVTFILNMAIDALYNSAVKCCIGGGIWKACLQPIVDKWYQWNQKWQIFGIPPDPAWD